MKDGLVGNPNQLIFASDLLPLSILGTFQDFKRRGDLIVRDKDFPELYRVYGRNGKVRGSILLQAVGNTILVIDDF
ncbi:MAG: hypothetical protein Q8P20_01905 [bacterium]|nr:hypothetical protein [bacterium]